MSELPRLLRSRHWWTAVSVCLTVGSAMIGFFLVSEGNRYVDGLRRQQVELGHRIDQKLADDADLSRRADMAAIMSLLDGDDKNHLLKLYFSRLPKIIAKENLIEMLGKIDQLHQQTIDTINDTYIEAMSLEDEIAHRQRLVTIYAGIAFVLQIAGLSILYAARDVHSALESHATHSPPAV